jgi:hypothetical protein
VQIEKVRDMSKIFEGIPAGSWVMLSRDDERVLAYSPDFDTAVRMASEKGDDDPVITRVPPSDGGMLFL